ncbi:hypothetical protein TD95_001738 [Thielaviopsis punctulata]|uniref:Rad4 beta-hairpin domain-containing protein n=1 Tax=Thielaviopsis punctulata TaxID=72032 RepID=A0A0F4ZAT5_9PEZI|nr:hypothetical protein TD95_001738 [Thielaviopsis punctulata]
MTRPQRPATRRSARSARAAASSRSDALPDIYRDMLAEARREEADHHHPQHRPAKRQRRVDQVSPRETEVEERTGQEGTPSPKQKAHAKREPSRSQQLGKQPELLPSRTLSHISIPNSEDDEDIEFEDIDLPRPAIQTIVRDSDSEDSVCTDSDVDSDDGQVIDFSHLDFENLSQAAAPSGDQQSLSLNLSHAAAAPERRAAKSARPKRKPLTKEQRQQRINTHQMHILCLLWHASLRNHWCNDAKVQKTLKKHLTQRTRDFLCPKKKMTPFAQTEAIKRGLEMAGKMWRVNFKVTEKGMHRALWAATPEELAAHQPPENLEICPTKTDFLDAAACMSGSRDVGAQLYCAFLRAAGMRCRLVCSLQVLPFTGGGPPMTAAQPQLTKAQLRKREMDEKKKKAMELYRQPAPTTGMAGLAHRRRAALASSSSQPPAPPPPPPSSDEAPEKESPYPVYWVEVLDKASQKWQPVDPLATHTFFRPRALEPPLSDRLNQATYILAFDANNTVRDVTARYARAFKAKTRRLRIDHASPAGAQWWHRVLAHYTKQKPASPLRLAEDEELAAALAREGMPKRIGDFRGHPDYVLARHVRRHEILSPQARVRGTIKPVGRAEQERVYSRADVKAVYSREKWFRLGRQVRPGEHPAKMLYRRVRQPVRDDDEPERDPATAVYTEDQTEAFQHPPVVDGRVPRNKFGNLEIYTASMVPAGGSYVAHKKAARAAHLLGIDYAPAVAGFEFRGRRGTAVIHGAVVAEEHEEAVRAVIHGLEEVYIDALEEKKRSVVLMAWRRFMRGLRIRSEVRRGMGLDVETSNVEEEAGDVQEKAEDIAEKIEVEEREESDLSDLSDTEYVIQDEDDEMAGGFIVDDDDDDDEMAGGFIID